MTTTAVGPAPDAGAATDAAPDRAAAPARQRMDDLEGYRGLAAVGIVVFHAYQFARGDATSSYAYPHTVAQSILRNLDGLVSMFLILSGFLLYLPIARKIMNGDSGGVVKVFLLRRAARILPLYWFAIVLVWAYRNPGLPGDWRDLVEHLTFTQVFDSKRIFYTIGPAWSLSVEVFFYLYLAITLVVLNKQAHRLTTRRARMSAVLAPPALLTVASLGWQAWALFVTHEPATRWAVWFNPVARADMFAVGMVVAIIAVSRSVQAPLGARVLVPMRFAALGLLVYGCAVRTDDPMRTTVFNLASVVAFGLLIASSVFDDPAHIWRRMLSGPRMAWLGLASYSLYIWHEPVLLFLDTHVHLDHAPGAFPIDAVILVAASLPVAWLSYRVIERPLGRLRLLLDDAGRPRNYYPVDEHTDGR